MTALDWVRKKAEKHEKLSETRSYEGVGTYQVTYHFFKGVVPYKMMSELKKQSKNLRQVVDGEESDYMVHEGLVMGDGTRSGALKVEYTRVEWQKID
jgi:hypothetical protein